MNWLVIINDTAIQRQKFDLGKHAAFVFQFLNNSDSRFRITIKKNVKRCYFDRIKKRKKTKQKSETINK